MDKNVSATTAAGMGILGGLVIAPAIIVLIILLICICCFLISAVIGISLSNSTAPTDSTVEVISAPAKEVVVETLGRIGEPVTVGDIKWNVIIVKNRGQLLRASESKYSFIAKDKSTSGKFVQVTIVIENMGKKSRLLRPLTIVDSKGREFSSATELAEWIPEKEDIFTIQSLNPNISFKFAQLFEIPADASGLKLKITDLSFASGQEKYVDLAL
jgi:hypothetical protein